MQCTSSLLGSQFGCPINIFFGCRNSLLKLASCYIVEVTNATYQSLVSLTSFKALKQAEGNAEVYVEAEYFILAYMCDFSIRKLEKKMYFLYEKATSLKAVLCGLYIHVTELW